MHYVSAEQITKSYGIQPLFENLSFHIEEGDKIALIARNGTGKSTILRILAGKESPDSGNLFIHKDVDVVLFEQDPLFVEEASVVDNIFFHDHPRIRAIREYEASLEAGEPARVNAAISLMDELGAWDFEAKVKLVLSRLRVHQLNQAVNTLSGGQRKRVALARTLIDIGFEHKHVLLLMDEPTNHLDVDMVEWLENYLDRQNVTLLLVTHDRYFLDAVCNEIWELDQQELHITRGDYETYLERKSQRREEQAASLDKAKNLYQRELEWMRKQPRARTTKSKSRQDRFFEVEKKAGARMVDDELALEMKMNRLGGKVAELKKVYKSFGEQVILKGFDYTFRKGERVGVIGKNGTGKSTFINILLGMEKADSGKINLGDTVVFGYYSQQGLQIKEDMRVIEWVKNIAESFPLAGGGSLTAAQFLQRFLFDPERQHTYISRLSGGEKRRLHLLSVLFRNPNFLVLDEPTNDLDLPTLAVLEEFLASFPGCLLIVSHDRYFMDKLVDHLFVFKGEGVISDFPGNYSQYRRHLDEEKKNDPLPIQSLPEPMSNPARKERRRQMSFGEKREFEQLEKDISRLNAEKERVTLELNSGETSFEKLQELSLRIGELSRELDEKELRWLELSELT